MCKKISFLYNIQVILNKAGEVFLFLKQKYYIVFLRYSLEFELQ